MGIKEDKLNDVYLRLFTKRMEINNIRPFNGKVYVSPDIFFVKKQKNC